MLQYKLAIPQHSENVLPTEWLDGELADTDGKGRWGLVGMPVAYRNMLVFVLQRNVTDDESAATETSKRAAPTSHHHHVVTSI
jgi:hypothetical protein